MTTQIGLGLVRKISADRTHGLASFFEAVIPPGMVVDPHVHTHEDECTRVIEGELVFQIGGVVLTASADDYVVKPRGVSHAFWNASSRPARVIEIVTPGTLDSYFSAFAEVYTSSSLTGDDRRVALDALQARFGIKTDWAAGAAISAQLRTR